MQQTSVIEKKYSKWIIAVSIIIPVAVAALFSVKLKDLGFHPVPLTFLPPIYASINGITAVVLIWAVMAVRRGKRKTHERLMTVAIGLSLSFLVMYIAYHMTVENTKYGDINGDGILDAAEKIKAGWMRGVYLFILFTHIVLSIAIIPMVLVSYVRALAERFDRHRKIGKITYPAWLYVAITGVIVYLMISPYYANRG
jgi:putative membrane protein